MDNKVFAAVLLAALFHAGWNALLKVRLEPLRAITLVSIASGLPAVPLVLLVPLPAPAAWPYIAVSLGIHLFYYLALGEAYRTGDLGQVYPIARGTAPLMTGGGATLLLGERLSPLGWTGLTLLAAGVMMLSLRGGRTGTRFEGRAVLFALLTALTITSYTIVDGIGARKTPDVLSYVTWLFLLDGLMMLAFGLLRWRSALAVDFASARVNIIAGGALSSTAYAIAIWAMTKAPVALVAALRETSVLFAALIGMAALREPVLPVRLTAVIAVCAGVMMLRLQ
jgi:drug/metabolite transporter (DMT)-like permease